ncbi:hypothetical protein [Herbiconiux sp.]|uniref:hypothetical protein n=1 Tax=Herbiconiux sp. TaxID=1871186 RepID=UPI0025B8CAF9|nr:hypothetical protein [Herbiconiux sp.]
MAAAPRPLWRAGIVVVLMFAAGILVALTRLPSDQWNVLWAEDGNQFLTSAFRVDYLTNLFTPYAGYMHLVPRTAAQLVAAIVPTSHLGLGMNLCGAAVWSAVALSAFVFTRGRIQDPLRWVLWLLVLVLPIGSMEVATNVSNSHWLLMFGLFMAVSARSGPGAAGVFRIVFASLLIVASVMSDPLSLAFTPFVLARVITLPKLRENVVSVVFVVAAAIQLIVVSGTERDRGDPQVSPVLQLTTYLVRVVWGDLLGQQAGTTLYNELGRHPVVVLAGVVVLALAVLIVVRWRRSGLAALALAGSLGFYAVVAVLTWNRFGLQPIGVEVYWGGRYLVVPTLLLLVSLVAMLSVWLPSGGRELSRGRRAGRAVGIGVVAVLLLLPGVFNYQVPAYKANVPPLSASVVKFQSACTATPTTSVAVPIAPQGFSFIVPCERILQN